MGATCENGAMEMDFADDYVVAEAERILTPALLIYPQVVAQNIQITLRMVGNDPERWRPHIKTAKLGAVIGCMTQQGIHNFKCSTTLELLTACQCNAKDILLAFAISGANAKRVIEIAEAYPKTRVSVLVESAAQANLWKNTGVGAFIDLNSGMNRTGMQPGHAQAIVALARSLGPSFRGVHWYDGHVFAPDLEEREASAHQGYDRLLEIVRALQAAGLKVPEVITSGTPTAPFGYSYPGFREADFVHRISPGTVVYNDVSSLRQLPDRGYRPAALVLSTVTSHPLPRQITCDAGHKSVSADAGVPTCAVIGYPDLQPLKPSEEHLPIETAASGSPLPAIGTRLYLLPRHVCPTVNNFDHALMIVDGRVVAIEPVTARGHESPLALSAYGQRELP
jgi:D-serine deaminase-like pyridoxal phosphate-dependent protein